MGLGLRGFKVFRVEGLGFLLSSDPFMLQGLVELIGLVRLFGG